LPAEARPTLQPALEKPLLDREAFQQLLAAAYVLQEQNERLVPSAPLRPDVTQALSELVEIQSLIHSQQVDLHSAASLIAHGVAKFTGADGSAVGLLKEDELTYQSATGIASDDACMPFPAAASLSAHSLTRGQAVQSLDAQRDRRLPTELCRQAGVQSFIAVPAMRDGKVAGVIELRFAKKNGFQEQDVRTCQLMTGLWAEAIARAAEIEWKQALANERATMIEALEKIKPQLEKIAVEPVKEAELPAAEAPLEGAAAEPEEVACRGCGHRLQEEESYCGLCGAPRPGEASASGDLQSKWASLWHLKQAADLRKSEELEAEETASEGPQDVAAPVEDRSPEVETSPTVRILPALEEASVTVASAAASTAPSPWTSASRARQWFESLGSAPQRKWLVRYRANVYLATAAVLLVAVIAGWGTHPDASVATGHGKVPAPPQLTLFENVLVDLGLAIPPPSSTYRGNPNTRVWEDERTALYYCPGADLYGKTERGKFSTQKDAQQDQFEPAFRRPCE